MKREAEIKKRQQELMTRLTDPMRLGLPPAFRGGASRRRSRRRSRDRR